MKELIVTFAPGISEDEARAAAEDAGGKVRRRMRSDSEDEVMLLLRIDGDLEAVKAKLEKRDEVANIEINQGGFTVS